MSPCGCDACAESATDSTGMCDFCATHCYPWEDIAGRKRRTARPLPDRVRLHATSILAEELHTTRQRTAEAAVRVVAPLVESGSRTLIDLIRRRLSGRDEDDR